MILSRTYRRAIREILSSQCDLRPVELPWGGAWFEKALVRHAPDVLIVDLPPEKTLALMNSLGRRPAPVVLVANCDESSVGVLVPLFEAGISGVVPHETGERSLVRMVRDAVSGRAYCPPAVVSALVQRIRSIDERRSADPFHLTPREVHVARGLEQGLTNKEIASQLGIEVSTTKNHVHSILAKLTARSRSEVARRLAGAEVFAPYPAAQTDLRVG